MGITRVTSLTTQNKFWSNIQSVADPGFDLTGGVDFVKGGRGVTKIIESVNILSISHILACFDTISIKIMLKMYREASKKILRKFSV